MSCISDSHRNKYLTILFFTLVTSFSVAACGGFVEPPPETTQAPIVIETPTVNATLPTYNGLGLSALETYSAIFEMKFQGEESWTYLMEMSTDGQLDEYHLNIEGGGSVLNLGELRFVTDGQTSWMIGSDSEDQCFQFPNELNLGPVFLTPDDVLESAMIRANIENVGDEFVNSIEASHFIAKSENLDTWQNIRLDIWMMKSNAAVLQFLFSGNGEDPIYDTGMGTISIDFAVTDIGKPEIDPVVGCEIALPLPDDVTNLVKMPGLISFEYPISLDDATQFYKSMMFDDGWELVVERPGGEEYINLSYQRENEIVEINITTIPSGVRVEILDR